jgi:hypothetical protein
VTVHGFRSTFATWAEECSDYPDGVREAALAHKYKSETTAAYQRGQKLEKRRALMKDWANFVLPEMPEGRLFPSRAALAHADPSDRPREFGRVAKVRA